MSFITRPVSRVLSPVLGFLLGSSKPPKIPAQMLGELADQTAKEGEPRPIVFGIGRPIGGNVMYQSQPIRRMVKTYVGKSGGKGGSKKKKQYQDVEHVYRYYAIRVCEGPITGFRRIWRNGALVYDARKGSAWGAKNNHLFFRTFRLYDGAWTQMPDPTLQSMLRDTNIPAFRGTAYLVAINEDLTELGGAIPQWQFEVVRSEGFYLTSLLYPFGGPDAATLKPEIAAVELVQYIFPRDIPWEPDKIALAPEIASVVLAEPIVPYDWAEQISLAPEIAGVELKDIIIPYMNNDKVALAPEIAKVELRRIVIPYNWAEQVALAPEIAKVELDEI